MNFIKNISTADRRYIEYLVSDGRLNDAIDLFLKNYLLPAGEAYAAYLAQSFPRVLKPMTEQQIGNLEMRITSTTAAFEEAVTKQFAKFMGEFIDPMLDNIGITSPVVAAGIKKNTVDLFNRQIYRALSQTDHTIRTGIRDIQKRLIQDKRLITDYASTSGVLAKDVAKFKVDLFKKMQTDHSEIFKTMQDGKFITYSDGKKVGFDTYAEMATRTTALNVERNAVEINERIQGTRVSEFYKADNRTVKEPRPVCRHIMSNTFYGVSIVAHDGAAAEVLGCMTLDNARSEGAFGPNCRHSIRPLSEETYIKIFNILYVAESRTA